ncbi:hypothetical protein ACFOD9_04245 [Novosphingobium bradum]|uniref:Fe-S oxidoreductase n=1 Tax=Novosphingobium bradum TaxID=1737444 RepID=A0ABV7ITG1_9SPHN
MRQALAGGTLVLAALAVPLAAQPGAGNMNSMPRQVVPVPADSPAAAALPPTTPTTVNNTLPPPPVAALNKAYPVCAQGMTDNCQNPGEGGAPPRSRPAKARHHHRTH